MNRKMKNGFTGMLLLLLLATVSCGEKKAPKTEQERLSEAIASLQDSLFNEQQELNEDKAARMVGLYQEYAEKFPDAPETPKYLFLAADVARALGRYDLRVDNYRKILEKYPDYKGKDLVVFLLATTLDADLNRREEAAFYYNRVVQTVKDTNLVNDARVRLETVDSLTYDQMIERIIRQEIVE